MNGKQHDHPISDIIDHQMTVYGEPTDGNIKKLGKLMDRHRLFAWFENLAYPESADVTGAVAKKLAELQAHAKGSGWEVD